MWPAASLRHAGRGGTGSSGHDPESTLALEDLTEADPVGNLGLALWRAPMRELPEASWAPRREYASLSGGKAGATGWRNLWILGGQRGSGQYLDDMWRSMDGAATWEPVRCGPHWSPRARLGVTGGQTASERPIGVMYVIGGQGNSGFNADVWASDTGGRTWHKMNPRAPFGPRADPACAVVSGEPLVLVVGGGVSVDIHRDLWLSRNGGENFAAINLPGGQTLPWAASLTPWPPHILCAGRTNMPGRLALWRLRLGAGQNAELESLDKFSEEAEAEEALASVSLPKPLKLTIDLQAQVLLSWDSKASCLVTHPLPLPDEAQRHPFGETQPARHLYIAAPGSGDAHIHCDMDSAFAPQWHGRIWLFSWDGKRGWASDRSRFRLQKRFLQLVGVRLQSTDSVPLEVWLGKVRNMVLPGPRRVLKDSTAE